MAVVGYGQRGIVVANVGIDLHPWA